MQEQPHNNTIVARSHLRWIILENPPVNGDKECRGAELTLKIFISAGKKVEKPQYAGDARPVLVTLTVISPLLPTIISRKYQYSCIRFC